MDVAIEKTIRNIVATMDDIGITEHQLSHKKHEVELCQQRLDDSTSRLDGFKRLLSEQVRQLDNPMIDGQRLVNSRINIDGYSIDVIKYDEDDGPGLIVVEAGHHQVDQIVEL